MQRRDIGACGCVLVCVCVFESTLRWPVKSERSEGEVRRKQDYCKEEEESETGE